jgi:Zn-dependent protease with chaperone function
MTDRSARRYGDDPVLQRATRRAVAAVAGAVVLLVVGLTVVVTVVAAKFAHWGAFKVIGATHGLALLVPFAIAVLWLLRELRRAERGTRLGRSDVAEVPPGDPLRVALERLAALADVPVPPLRIVASDRPNSSVVVAADRVQTICVTTAAVEQCAPAELDAMLAHELFHIAHGDASLTSRLEAIAELADRKVGFLAGWIVPAVRSLMRQRELSADRAAALLTGSPSDLDAAVRTCTSARSGPADLRLVMAVPFVEASPAGPLDRRTHPSVDERAANLARVAAQLGQR